MKEANIKRLHIVRFQLYDIMKRQNGGKNKKISDWGFPNGPVVKTPSSNAGAVSLISGQGDY